MIAMGILLTYGLQLTVTADLAWQGLRRKLVRPMKGTVSDQYDGEEINDDEKFTPRLTMYYYGMRFSLILGTSKNVLIL